MSTNRVVLPRPTSPASTLGAGGNVPNTLEPQRARAPQNITAQSPVTPVSNPVAAGAMVAGLRRLLSAGTPIADAGRAPTRVSPGPRRDFILSLGFALQRANSRMLRDADRRRRKARSCGIYSSGTRPSSLSSDDDY